MNISEIQRGGHYCAHPPRSANHIASDVETIDSEAGAVVIDPSDSISVNETVTIRVLALYPTDLKDVIKGGAPGISTMMALAQLQTNEIFHNSGVRARVEIITQELPVLRHIDVVGLLADVVGPHDGLAQWGKPRIEAWNAVSHAREKAEASIIYLLTNKPTMAAGGTVSGTASHIPEPPRFDRSDLSYATFCIFLEAPIPIGYLFTHELGHLLGGKHDQYTMDPETVSLDRKYDYVRGYVPADASFVTIMGYSHGGTPLIPAYSAADRTWNNKPLGIPVGQPDAADAARFFRKSTRVIAKYREARSHPDWFPVDLQVAVSPLLGGTIELGALGPYVKNSQVKATAIPRANFEFSHWSLDEKELGTRPTQTVLIDQAHTLTAHFKAGDGLYALDVVQPPGELNLTIVLSHGGGVYRPGTELHVNLVGDNAALIIDYWIIDGQPAGNKTEISLHVVKNHKIQVKLRSSAFLLNEIHSPMHVEAGSTHMLQVRVSNRIGNDPIPKKSLIFSLTDTSTRTRLLGTPQVQTNSEGIASAIFEAGAHAGAFSITASLENEDARPIIFRFAVSRYVLVPTRDHYRILPKDPPVQIEALMRELGRPVAGKEVMFYLKATPHALPLSGLTLYPSNATTDEHGIAKVLLSHSANSSKSFKIHAVYLGSDTSPACLFSVPAAIQDISTP